MAAIGEMYEKMAAHPRPGFSSRGGCQCELCVGRSVARATFRASDDVVPRGPRVQRPDVVPRVPRSPRPDVVPRVPRSPRPGVVPRGPRTPRPECRPAWSAYSAACGRRRALSSHWAWRWPRRQRRRLMTQSRSCGGPVRASPTPTCRVSPAARSLPDRSALPNIARRPWPARSGSTCPSTSSSRASATSWRSSEATWSCRSAASAVRRIWAMSAR